MPYIYIDSTLVSPHAYPMAYRRGIVDANLPASAKLKIIPKQDLA